MKEFSIDWKVGGTFCVEANTEAEAEQLLIDDFEFILKDALGNRLQGLEIEDISYEYETPQAVIDAFEELNKFNKEDK